ncbi:MAG: hypothetical protein KAI38_02565, partial [Candidatus Latescibacteria bacterium]|nr:hypothetical protein [Candidatus Latescibacterota bacterium]
EKPQGADRLRDQSEPAGKNSLLTNRRVTRTARGQAGKGRGRGKEKNSPELRFSHLYLYRYLFFFVAVRKHPL